MVTSTFHGAALSIKLGKQFAVFPRKSQKLWGLLKDFSLLSRVVSDVNTSEQLYHTPIDYETVNGLLERSRAASLAYLLNALEGGNP